VPWVCFCVRATTRTERSLFGVCGCLAGCVEKARRSSARPDGRFLAACQPAPFRRVASPIPRRRTDGFGGAPIHLTRSAAIAQSVQDLAVAVVVVGRRSRYIASSRRSSSYWRAARHVAQVSRRISLRLCFRPEYEDSTEGDRSFRREADHGSGRKPIRRRSEATLALRCCQDWSESSSEICPERSEGRIPLAEKGARGKGRSSFPRLSTAETVAGSAEGSETA
jgi:hypothetical protein